MEAAQFISERMLIDRAARVVFDDVRDAFILACGAAEPADTRTLTAALRAVGAVPGPSWERPRSWRGIRLRVPEDDDRDLELRAAQAALGAAQAEHAAKVGALRAAHLARGSVSGPAAPRLAVEAAARTKAALREMVLADRAVVAARARVDELTAPLVVPGPALKRRAPTGPDLSGFYTLGPLDHLEAAGLRLVELEREIPAAHGRALNHPARGRFEAWIAYNELCAERKQLEQRVAEIRAEIAAIHAADDARKAAQDA